MKGVFTKEKFKWISFHLKTNTKGRWFSIDKGVLFVCATPIGHLDDVSFRLLETLRSVDFIVCEDTRKLSILFQKFNFKVPAISLEKHNEASRLCLIQSKLDSGHHVALISDAGTPGIADPGAYLISTLRDYCVTPIPGPSSVTTLLSVSGLLSNRYIFGGFFPKGTHSAYKELLKHSHLDCPVVYFESPLRLLKTLQFFEQYVADAHLVVGKELTKKFEQIFYGNPSHVLQQLDHIPIKGEWVFAVSFPQKSYFDLQKKVSDLQALSLSQKDILAICKIFGYSKNEAYPLLHA